MSRPTPQQSTLPLPARVLGYREVCERFERAEREYQAGRWLLAGRAFLSLAELTEATTGALVELRVVAYRNAALAFRQATRCSSEPAST